MDRHAENVRPAPGEGASLESDGGAENAEVTVSHPEGDSNPFLSAALSYAARGWAVHPLRARDKLPMLKQWPERASTDPAKIAAWWRRTPTANIGIATGSGLLVLDVDGDEGRESLNGHHLPPTVTARTGGGGWHYFYQVDGETRNTTNLLPHVDTRGDGGYVVAAPSVHPSGAAYTWADGMSPDDLPLAPAPQWLVDALRPKAAPPAPDSPTTTTPAREASTTTRYGQAALDREAVAVAEASVGARNHRLNTAAFSIGQLVAGGEVARADAERMLTAAGREAGLEGREVVATVASGLNSGALSPRSAPGTGPDDPDPGDDLLQFNTTDMGNGEAFAHLFGDDIRYDWTRERWLRWAGHLWAPADYGHLTELAKTAARRRYMQASHAGDRGEQQRKHAFRSEARGRAEACLFFARAEDPITDPGDGWDVDPWLIGCANGVFDIRTGEFRAGRRDDRLTMQAGVSFDPAAECPLWHSFLRDVFNGDRELIDYVHRAIGYSLTGSVRDDCFFVCYGSGANGKSVFSEVLRIAFGDYGHHAPFDLFDYSCRNQHPQGLALLEGRRFVTALEAAPGARLNEQRVKSLAGGDPITAHLMRQNDRTFTCTSHLWLSVNHRPRVLDDSPGFWRKARMIPFNRRFVPQEQIDRNPELRDDLGVLPADEKLRPRLLSEAAGILRWAAEGAHLWASEGIQTPACVVAGSEAWRDEADPIGEFLRCFCVTGPDLRTPAGALWAAYEMFVTHEGIPARERLTNTAFGRLLGARFNRVRAQWGGKLQRMYTGVALRADKEAEE